MACLLALFFFALVPVLATNAFADDWADCRKSTPEMRISGCSKIISKSGVADKDLALAYGFRGGGHLNKGDKDKAIADLSQALRLKPNPSDAHLFSGLLHVAKEEQDKGIVEFDEALRVDPKNVRALISRGITFNNKRALDRALTDFNEAIRLDPKFALAYVNRGTSHRSKGDVDRAIADFNEAIRLEPRYASAFRLRGSAYIAKNDYDRAMADLNEAIRLDPNNALAYHERGWAYATKADYERAIADYSFAIKLNPKYINAFNNRGRSHAAKGKHERAVADFSDAIRIDVRYVHAYNNRGLSRFKMGQTGPAIADYEEAIRLDAAYPPAYNNRGTAYAKQGETGRAIADFTKVLELPAPAAPDKQRQDFARERIARLREMPPVPSPLVTKHRRVALVIGNAKYANASALTNPSNDAKAIAARLRRLDFTLVNEEHDVSRERMAQALKEFGDRAEGAEWAVVFFAGHGLELNGTTYLIPVDAQLMKDTHVEDEAISLSRVQAKVDAASKLGLVILDSCRNSPFLARMTRSGGATRAIGNGLAAIEPEGNVLIAYSAKHGTVAEDGKGQHSPFTEALLAHIEEPGLEINFLFRRVRDEVRKKTERRQEPFLYGSLGSELMFFKNSSTR